MVGGASPSGSCQPKYFRIYPNCAKKIKDKRRTKFFSTFLRFSARKSEIKIKMLTFDEVTGTMQVDPTSKTPYSDATQVSLNKCENKLNKYQTQSV